MAAIGLAAALFMGGAEVEFGTSERLGLVSGADPARR